MMYLFMKLKDLGHFWLGYIRMLGHLQPASETRGSRHKSSKSSMSFMDVYTIGTMTIESIPHP